MITLIYFTTEMEMSLSFIAENRSFCNKSCHTNLVYIQLFIKVSGTNPKEIKVMGPGCGTEDI
jgi:hypothetical protein